MDMSIGEFEEVGEIIKSFASDQATVVVGTVIDPEMSDELRVTIVVTGLEDADQNNPRNWYQSIHGRATGVGGTGPAKSYQASGSMQFRARDVTQPTHHQSKPNYQETPKSRHNLHPKSRFFGGNSKKEAELL